MRYFIIASLISTGALLRGTDSHDVAVHKPLKSTQSRSNGRRLEAPVVQDGENCDSKISRFGSAPRPLTAATRQQYEKYLDATVKGLQQLDRADHLPKDMVFYKEEDGQLRPQDQQRFSGPTDFGMKLIAYSGLLKYPRHREAALTELKGLMDTLEKLPFHERSGLFYRLYNPRGETRTSVALNSVQPSQDRSFPVIDADISAIDNFHAYLGLNTLAHSPDPAASELAKRAKLLFSRMRFSDFYDAKTNTFGGNLNFSHEQDKDTWTLEEYRAGFNSELRQTLTGLYALDGLGAPYQGSEVLQEILRKVRIEFDENGRLMTWVGGGFESDLATVTLGESAISCAMRQNGRVRRENTFQKDLLRVHDVEGEQLQVPHVPSASIVEVQATNDTAMIRYDGNVGRQDIKDSNNKNAPNEKIIVPHAVLLLAAGDPVLASKSLTSLERVGDEEVRLFDDQHGWLVSARLEEKSNGTVTAKVNRAQTAVDGYFGLVAILTALDPEHLSPSARALRRDPRTADRLAKAYGIVDTRYLKLPIEPASLSLRDSLNSMQNR